MLTTSTASLSGQFQRLIFQPIEAIMRKFDGSSLLYVPFLAVLDGLDECEDRDEVAGQSPFPATFLDLQPSRRPPPSAASLLYKATPMNTWPLLDVAIVNEKRGRIHSCYESWPSLEDMIKPVGHIGGYFIFMTTILRILFDPYLHSDGLTPTDRLPMALGMDPDFDIP
ncbi:hypothetical protein FA13DRAFT_1793172 [Coprinellus micaceus]|uniref:Uncharacterized protein n=1 Tax=Coprinellus micaceus TaxID=71717 RepID=A0A4Y7T7G8_COPMI|nr:hypothetical protein FA13DRAFT_1793172 [Coprinellus micaceus]